MDKVQALLEGRVHRQRGPEYRVRWVGSDGADDEWFPASAVEDNYPQLLLEFENRTGWFPDEDGNYPPPQEQHTTHSNHSNHNNTQNNHATTSTVSSTTSPTHVHSAPMYSWKSSSKPPPKMTKQELKTSLKELSKYTADRTFTKNYADIAIDYRKQVKYIARKDNAPNVVGAHPSSPPTCSMCNVGKCRQVFFPCQHACVCDNCIQQHEIGVLNASDPTARTWNACPLCVEKIVRVVPLHDQSEENYFKWLHEAKPPVAYVDQQKFAKMCITLNQNFVSIDAHVQPKIQIGDWQSEDDWLSEGNEQDVRRKERVEERRREMEERGRMESSQGDGSCCCLS